MYNRDTGSAKNKTNEGIWGMEGNLTKGPIMKTLVKLAVPIMASSFLGTLYNLTDMAWIGLLGAKAVAGVGVGGMFTWLSQGLASMARMGGQVQVAQCIGRGDREKAHGFAQAAVQLSAAMGIAYAVLCLIFVNQMVGFFRLEDAEAQAAALSYTKIACGLIVFSFLTLTLTGLYTAQGDSKTPFMANLIGLMTNMILDPVLILGPGPFPRLGVTGAAIATVTAQAIVMSIMILGIIARKRENVLKGTRLFAKIPAEFLRGICRIGIPTAIQGMAYCGISMILTRMVSGYGAEAVATQRVGGQIESISWNTADGFAAALNAFVAQNYGANQPERIRKGIRSAAATSAVFCICISVLVCLFAAPLIQIFMDPSQTGIVAAGVHYLHIEGACYLGIGMLFLLYGYYRAVNQPGMSVILTIASLGTRVALAYLLSATPLGVTGIWLSVPIGWALADAIGIGYYFKNKKTKAAA